MVVDLFPCASLRWHYPDQVRGCFSPGQCCQPGPLAFRLFVGSCGELYAHRGLCHHPLPYNVRFRRNLSQIMELAKSFEPADIEKHWRAEWEKRGYYTATTDAGNGAPASS